MPPPLILDLSTVDLERVEMTADEIYEKYLPQRHQFSVLSGACYFDLGTPPRAVCFADIPKDAWWVAGHIPGRPLLPGVLMLEMGAQTAAVLAGRMGLINAFLGFGGVDHCKFRDAVVPPARLYLLCEGIEHRPRRIVSRVQGVANGRMIFEATITGLTMG